MNIAKAALVWDHDETAATLQSVCTLHIRAPDERDPFSEADLEAITLALDAWWHEPGPFGPSLPPDGARMLYPPSLRLNSLEAERILPTPSAKYVLSGENSPGTALSFSIAGETLKVVMFPPQCCWLVKLVTAESSRNDRGRLYLPAANWNLTITGFGSDPSDADYAIGKYYAANRQDLGYAMANLAHRIRWITGTENEFVWVVYSPTTETANAVLSFHVHDYLRTQRRRSRYPGTLVAFGLSGESA